MDLYEYEGLAAGETPVRRNSTDKKAQGGSSETTDSTSTAVGPGSPGPSLYDEAQAALGSLGGWWGGFRRQSISALATARQDLASVAIQAQKELSKVGQYVEEATTSPRASMSSPRGSTTSPRASTTDEPSTITAEGEEGETIQKTRSPTHSRSGSLDDSRPRSPTSPSALATSFFSYLQSSLPPAVTSTAATASSNIRGAVQRTLTDPQVQAFKQGISTNVAALGAGVQSGVQTVQANPTVQGLQSSVQNLSLQDVQTRAATIGSTIQSRAGEVGTQISTTAAPIVSQVKQTTAPLVSQIQQTTTPYINQIQANPNVKAAGGFVSETYGEFWKGAGEFFREAFQVLPPDGDGRQGGNVVVDAGGVWVFDDLGGAVEDTPADAKGKGKTRGDEGIAVNRTAALLNKLRTDPDLIRANPESDVKSKETYLSFLDQLEEKGAAVDSAAWIAKCQNESSLFEELRNNKDALVPSELDETTFWKRYWFRAWQIREAEERRKRLLAATVAQEEETGWGDSDEETDKGANSTPVPRSKPAVTSQPAATTIIKPESVGMSKDSGSGSKGRDSEESYDIVSTRSGNASGTALASKASPAKPKAEESDEDEDEDEDDDDDDDDDEDEDEDEDEEEEEEPEPPKPAPKAAAAPAPTSRSSTQRPPAPTSSQRAPPPSSSQRAPTSSSTQRAPPPSSTSRPATQRPPAPATTTSRSSTQRPPAPSTQRAPAAKSPTSSRPSGKGKKDGSDSDWE